MSENKCAATSSKNVQIHNEHESKTSLLREIREVFRTFDRNHNNTISAGDLGRVLKCLGMNVCDEEVQTFTSQLDKNGTGHIEYKEFKAFIQWEQRKSEEPKELEKIIRLAFQVFDANGDGCIEVEELKRAMQKLGEPLTDKELVEMMKEADIDQNNKIDYEEFIKVWIKTSVSNDDM